MLEPEVRYGTLEVDCLPNDGATYHSLVNVAHDVNNNVETLEDMSEAIYYGSKLGKQQLLQQRQQLLHLEQQQQDNVRYLSGDYMQTLSGELKLEKPQQQHQQQHQHQQQPEQGKQQHLSDGFGQTFSCEFKSELSSDFSVNIVSDESVDKSMANIYNSCIMRYAQNNGEQLQQQPQHQQQQQQCDYLYDSIAMSYSADSNCYDVTAYCDVMTSDVQCAHDVTTDVIYDNDPAMTSNMTYVTQYTSNNVDYTNFSYLPTYDALTPNMHDVTDTKLYYNDDVTKTTSPSSFPVTTSSSSASSSSSRGSSLYELVAMRHSNPAGGMVGKGGYSRCSQEDAIFMVAVAGQGWVGKGVRTRGVWLQEVGGGDVL